MTGGGMALAIWSPTAYGLSNTRAASRTAALPLICEKVII